ncbi:uncharacterized protein LOC134253978 [Saccostrea cucullata]|uniref:uncharacterized protein LOC134253978 n=1 Tax=Saccostrea cuccullata TaxID=36930 RepID=UPI002ED4B6F6
MYVIFDVTGEADVLGVLERANKIGASIGTTFIGCPTVADDIAFISHNPSDLQQALHIVHNETKRDKVTINSSKSDVIIINAHKNRPTQTWTLGDKEIEEVETTKHVGLIRSSNGKNDIQSRIQLGRRTMYALLGAGLHGKNGINPKVSYKIYTTFCRPRMTYGLEAVILSSSEEQELLFYERKLLKQIQGLSVKTPIVAVYSLLGAIPITVCIEKNTLTAFYKIIKNQECAEYEVARRQLALKDQNSNSWFTHVRKLLQKYHLPTAYELMETPPSTGKWKTMIDQAIQEHQTTQWQNESNRAKFNQHTVSSTCLLCNAASEDREHLILHCSTYQAIRDKHLDALYQLLVQHYNPQTVSKIMCNSTNLLQCLLDSSKTEILDILGKNSVITMKHSLYKNINSTLIILSTEGIQHISESVFVGLCHIVGTSQVVAMRRDVVDTWVMVKNQVNTSDKVCRMLSGSHREGFRLKGSDIDEMYWRNDQRVIWELSQSQYYNTRRHEPILCDCSDSPPGFTLLYLLSPSMYIEIQEACVRMNNRYYISSSKHRQIFLSVVSLPYKLTPHGPCVSGTFGTQEFDQAYCFVSDFWPPSASSWIDRCHSWPPPHVVDDIVKNGCHFVAIGHKLGNHEDHEWRISFSLAEQKLVYVMNHCQFLTYGLLKLFLTEIINNEVSDDKLLCSYHMKTTVFWVIQQNTIPHWCPQTLLGSFWVCFKLILKWVYEGVCPNFFIPGNNMFLSKIHGIKQQQLFRRLSELYEKGLAFLLHSPSIRSFIIDVLYNPRNSICTNDHTLISEFEFDKNVIEEIQRHCLIPAKLDIQKLCIRYLHTIEQMIGSHLLTQYQVIMLQKFTATFLQFTAFKLHMETYTSDNKLRYRVDKMSCRMLKLTAMFGCIADMLYIAMYYYKTLRYMEALSILEMIKVKLAQPYAMYMVMYMGYVDTEMYIKVVWGQSTKMRQAVAEVPWSTKIRQAGIIRLDNEIHYISELIPEQQSTLQNHRFSLIVPPCILLYMLEILCYRHVDTMRAQTALDDLQTLVHYDQGQFIPLHLRDISWQILGICQQVTGNLQAALYSYQQSLRQIPYNNIQTATEMRIQRIYQWISLMN